MSNWKENPHDAIKTAFYFTIAGIGMCVGLLIIGPTSPVYSYVLSLIAVFALISLVIMFRYYGASIEQWVKEKMKKLIAALKKILGMETFCMECGQSYDGDECPWCEEYF